MWQPIRTVLSDLSAQRRGLIRDFGLSPSDAGDGSSNSDASDELPGGMSTVHALVPLAELIGYSSAFRSLTAGQASFTLEFDSYGEVPAALVEQVTSGASWH